MKCKVMMGAAAVLLATACAATNEEAGLAPADVPMPPTEATVDANAERINAAIINDARPETDIERDTLRNPAAVIEFMDLQPGDTLLELEAGGGYFTEIFSRYLNDDAKLYMQNPAAFDAFLGNSLESRLDGLGNVEYLKVNFDEMMLDDASIDVATWFQGPHELWYTPESGTKLVTNPDNAFPEIFRVLKPGATLVVIDHTAPAGAPASNGGDTHRIDPQIIKDMAREAGFVLVAESDLFDNPDDDLTVNVFDEKVRGMTDQFMIKFEKPAG
ncbi:methyltransferase domain-containing protein [Henriciella sp. AS95]|uniref:class I SAM-dependent methyltransferase n=1 Tax=Henriciella sp. AS95 TaxID=3135782 RepID=UPI0031732697